MSTDPIRLIDGGGDQTPGLGRDLRAARGAGTSYDVDAGLARFSASIGVAGAIGAAGELAGHGASVAAPGAVGTAAVATQAAVASAKAMLAVKVALSTVALASVGVASLALVGVVEVSSPAAPARAPAGVASPLRDGAPPEHGARQAPTLPMPPPQAPPPAPPAPPTPAERVAPAAAPCATPSAPSAPAPSVPTPRASAPSPSSASSPVASTPASADDAEVAVSEVATPAPAGDGSAGESRVKAEMEQLARIRQSGDPARALALADEGHARFPRGVFWQEREAAAITALTRLGRTADAAARARAFIARHPESPYASQLRDTFGP
jgi:hypothetical protein